MSNPTITGFPAGTWKLDAAHSELSFSVRHLAISKVKGKFEKFDVTVVTGEDAADAKITATVDVSSVNTGQADRDGHLRTGDFFLTDEHPTMEFESSKITQDGEHWIVEGDLTLRGVTKPVVLKGEFGGVIVNGYGQTVAGAEFTTKIDRTAFGVNWNAAVEAGGLTLGNDVTVTFDLQVALQA